MMQLSEITIKKAEDLAVRYFKKTYHAPKYRSAKLIRKWYFEIAHELNIKIFGNVTSLSLTWDE